ncbi:4977_t:CDS:2 [Funneliformis caledonium]|uniref:4977_t:CDS:1 n=1 Tax=Funneliformis caledonium TaxID=1117310 RepID=A0A9N9BK35_9GLOM|nr:4977_t:CDS:2 [Funneliformis caledonium]
MRLEKLELCEAKNQFPKTGLPINRLNNRVMNLDSLVVQKWYITLKELTIDDIKTECNKNKKAINEMKDSDLKKFLEESHIVTVIFTSRPFKGNSEDLPDNCLIISKENFNQYFGPLFASRLTFNIINDLNINSAELKRISEMIKGVGDILSKVIHENRSYKSATEVIEKNPTYRSYLEKVRTQLEDCSYAPYSFLDNENDSMILNEYDSYLNDNDIEMDIDL